MICNAWFTETVRFAFSGFSGPLAMIYRHRHYHRLLRTKQHKENIKRAYIIYENIGLYLSIHPHRIHVATMHSLPKCQRRLIRT